MSELITLSKKDDRFQAFLDGSFASDKRALPVQSLNVNTDEETITFEVLPLSALERPKFVSQWFQILKLRNLWLWAVPVILIFLENFHSAAEFDFLSYSMSAIGALFLLIGANLRNDYLDHLSGSDRIHPQLGSQAIQKGWVAAREVKLWSSIYFFLGVMFGFRSFVLHPEAMLVLFVIAACAALAVLVYKSGFKFRKWSEFTSFFILGPCLVFGLQINTGVDFSTETALISLICGLIGVFYILLKNFSLLMVQGQARFENIMTYLGFEKGKFLLATCWLSLVLTLCLNQFLFSPQIIFTGVMFIGTVIVSLPFLKLLYRLKSPIGSGVNALVQTGTRSIYILTGVWLALAALSFWLAYA